MKSTADIAIISRQPETEQHPSFSYPIETTVPSFLIPNVWFDPDAICTILVQSVTSVSPKSYFSLLIFVDTTVPSVFNPMV